MYLLFAFPTVFPAGYSGGLLCPRTLKSGVFSSVLLSFTDSSDSGKQRNSREKDKKRIDF
jgi:hypothetical protein